MTYCTVALNYNFVSLVIIFLGETSDRTSFSSKQHEFISVTLMSIESLLFHDLIFDFMYVILSTC